MWRKALIFVVLAIALAVFYGGYRWQAGTESLRLTLRASAGPAEPVAGSPLPEPVERYLRTVLPPGQSRILAATFTHEGTFNLGDTDPKWRPFTSHQLVIANPPGFDWDARISLLPGIDAFVHDSFVAGEGILQVEALGLVPISNLRGTPEVAQGELQRFLAESPWYPTRLRTVEWQPIDAHSARATLRHGNTTASLIFRFNDSGLIDSVEAAARFRFVGGAQVPTPWHCRLWSYERRDGILIPIEGEVSWLTPQGARPYWRGRITSIQFELERKSS